MGLTCKTIWIWIFLRTMSNNLVNFFLVVSLFKFQPLFESILLMITNLPTEIFNLDLKMYWLNFVHGIPSNYFNIICFLDILRKKIFSFLMHIFVFSYQLGLLGVQLYYLFKNLRWSFIFILGGLLFILSFVDFYLSHFF